LQFTATNPTTSGGGSRLKVKCLHGFFIFEEKEIGQVSDFVALTGLELVPYGEAWTFAALATAPKYSLAGKELLGIPATQTFEGTPWEVFKANGFVYDFGSGLVRPITGTTVVAKIEAAGNRYISPGLLLPGSLTPAGDRVQDYSAFYYSSRNRWLYSEVTYV